MAKQGAAKQGGRDEQAGLDDERREAPQKFGHLLR
jgi:hypothetical protein